MLPAAKLLRCIITAILRSVFLPVCVFVSSVIVIFVSIKRRSDSHGAKRREKEEKSRKEEKKRRGTTLTKVVSSLSPSPTHQGLQHWRRAMQPVVVLHAATTRTTLTKVSTISNSPTSPALASSYAASSCEQVGRICGELEGWRSREWWSRIEAL